MKAKYPRGRKSKFRLKKATYFFSLLDKPSPLKKSNYRSNYNKLGWRILTKFNYYVYKGRLDPTFMPIFRKIGDSINIMDIVDIQPITKDNNFYTERFYCGGN